VDGEAGIDGKKPMHRGQDPEHGVVKRGEVEDGVPSVNPEAFADGGRVGEGRSRPIGVAGRRAIDVGASAGWFCVRPAWA
jgi:hypothetical protein